MAEDPAATSADVRPPPWVGDPLPRGRHKIPREDVRASQRERLLRAMTELVGTRGYADTSVPQIVAAARVSTNTFYGFFADKVDCFIALCEQLGDELLGRLVTSTERAQDVPDALAALDDGLRVYLQWWPERPALARAYFVELPMAGPRAIAERDRQSDRFAEVLTFVAERARVFQPELPPVRGVEVRAAAILTRELVADEVRAGRVNEVPRLHDDMRYLLLKLLVGEDAARRER
jgi:AcrR family transcriptional regulator